MLKMHTTLKHQILAIGSPKIRALPESSIQNEVSALTGEFTA